MAKSTSVRMELLDSAGFRLSVPYRHKYVVAGTDADYSISLERLAGHNLDVGLTQSDIPAGATASFDDNELSVGESAVLSIGTAGVAPGGHYFLEVGAQAQAGDENTVYAYSPSLSDVQDAVNAAATGNTVRVPAGSATWTGQLVITKGILLIGAGEGQTIITGAYTGHSTSTSYLTAASYLIAYVPANPALDEPFRLSGITFDFGGVSHGLYLKNGTTSPITKVRIDHCNMSNSYGNANLLLRHGTVYGVADNCTFDGGFFMFKSFGLNATTWNNIAFNYGGRNFYFEDCDITCTTMCIEGGLGGEYALRHNNITILTGTGGLFDIHGNAANHATLGVEVYENDINTGTRGGNILDHRGGMALCYNNNITSTGSWFNKVREEYLDSITPPANNAVTGQPQHVSSSYYWGNRKNGTTLVNSSITGTVDYGGSIGLVPQWGVDCWRETVPFTGASGEVGTGLLVARPSSGLSVGVGYWATDTQTLYRATSATTWETYYTPYSYLHPLRSDPILGD